MNKIVKEFKHFPKDEISSEWKINCGNKHQFSVIWVDPILRVGFHNHEIGKLEFIHNERFRCGFVMTTEKVKKILKFNGFMFPTENMYNVDYKSFKDDATAEDFQSWWNNEGSGITIEEGEDIHEFVHRVCGIAWNNGAFKEKYK